MGHTDNDILDTVVNTAVNKSLHTRNKGFATLETESLIVGDTALLINRVLERVGDLETLTEPVALVTVRNVNELNTERTAVDSLASVNDLAESHLLTAITLEARQDTGAESVLGVHILLSESVVLESQFLRLDVGETLGVIGASDTERVNLGGVVAARLVSADEKLDLEMVGDIGTVLHGQVARKTRDAASHARNQVRRRLESLRDGHLAALHVLEVDLPRDVDALGILSPLHVHLIDVAGGASGKEVRRAPTARGRREAASFHDEVRAERVEMEAVEEAAEHRAPRRSCELALQSEFLNMVGDLPVWRR
ncbi:hypothetical protein HG531_000360 [Fusarium graminearum]|nr:hypothetical protein HG531_000360 [Fusarium graminearum]